MFAQFYFSLLVLGRLNELMKKWIVKVSMEKVSYYSQKLIPLGVGGT